MTVSLSKNYADAITKSFFSSTRRILQTKTSYVSRILSDHDLIPED